MEILSASGSWQVDIGALGEDAALAVSQSDARIEVALVRGNALGYVPLDFRASLDMVTGIFHLKVDHLRATGSIAFDDWVRGKPLRLAGGQLFFKEPGDVTIRAAGVFELTADWILGAKSLTLAAPAPFGAVSMVDARLSLPLTKGLKSSAIQLSAMVPPSNLRLGAWGQVIGIGSGGESWPLACLFHSAWTEIRIQQDGVRLELGPAGRPGENGLRMDLENALARWRFAPGSWESALTAYAGDGEGFAQAGGITTLISMPQGRPIIQLAANGEGIQQFFLDAWKHADLIDCEGIACDRQREPEPIRIALQSDIQALPGFEIDAATGTLSRTQQSLRLHLRQKETRTNLWLDLHNVEFAADLAGALSPTLVKLDESREAVAVFTTPPQHIGEKSQVIDTSNQDAVPILSSSALEASASKPSRIVLRMPAPIFPYRFSVESMLQWQYFQTVTGPQSSGDYKTSGQSALDRLFTVFGLFRMSLVPVRVRPSPEGAAPALRWMARGTSIKRGAPNEAWHARLFDTDLRGDPAVAGGAAMAVAAVDDWVWPIGKVDCGPSQSLIWPLSQRDRFELRVLTFLRKFASSENSGEMPHTPRPLFGATVVISSLGGWFHLEGSWEVDELGISLVRYLHKIAQGRDVDVTVVREYFMYPFGHRMLLIKQTKRQNRQALRAVDRKPTVAARLETRFFLLAKDDSLEYPAWVQPMPLRTVNIAPESRSSPLLDYQIGAICLPDEYCPPEPVPKSAGGSWIHQAFWVSVGGARYEYVFDGVDYAGRTRRFKRSVIMIEHARDGTSCMDRRSDQLAATPTSPWDRPAAWLSARFADSRVSFNGVSGVAGVAELERLDFAMAPPQRDGDTDLEAIRISLTAKWKPPKARLAKAAIDAGSHTCPWVPSIHWAEGRFKAGALPNAQYTGGEPENMLRWLLVDPGTGLVHHPEEAGRVLSIQTQPTFVASATDIAQVQAQSASFAERGLYALIDQRASAPPTRVQTQYAANTSHSGGLISPDVVLGAASQKVGATAVPSLAAGSARRLGSRSQGALLSEFFPASSKLCGVELVKIIAPLFEGAGLPPAFKDALIEIEDGPDTVSSDLNWSIAASDDSALSRIKPFPDSGDANAFFFPGHYVGTAVPKQDCSLDLDASAKISLLGLVPPEINLSASVSRFTVHIGWGSGSGFNGVRIPVRRIAYVSRNGQKPDFQISLGEIVFIGPALEFIDQIRKKLEELGKNESGWRIGFENNGVVVEAPPLKFPDVQLGAFSVENLGIYSGLHVPFFNGGGITAWFSLARPDLRFRVTAGIYAGGGYALIELDTDHVRRFELCIEFGAAKSLRYGPVSGDVGVMGGLIYKSLTAPAYQSDGLPDTLQTTVEIEAFVRTFGNFSAWSLISLYMELYVSMTSSSSGGVAGIARFTISTKVGFVSYSYTASHREQLQKRGGGAASSRRLHPNSVRLLSGSARPASGTGPEVQIHTGSAADLISIDDLRDYLEAFEA